ncbi:MAG: hypothetical protein CM15mP120_13440 [Pseudomonadota bacterium]|nr:MAG: hypothetical protein CM15mP120_13440 [Pseudomonadota bacterium]
MAVIGLLLAATTGIIGASVVLLALLGLPAMLQQGYDKSLASGTVCAVGTLGILIPPSIMLVLMADRMAMSVGDLFLGAVFPVRYSALCTLAIFCWWVGCNHA